MVNSTIILYPTPNACKDARSAINDLCYRGAMGGNYYVYAQVDGDTERVRITKARVNKGKIQVLQLGSGEWGTVNINKDDKGNNILAISVS